MDAKHLPDRWKAKIEALDRAATESRDLAKGAQGRIAMAERQVMRAERRCQEIADSRAAPEPGRDTAAQARAQLEEAEKALADAKRRLAEEREAHRLHGERQMALRSVVRAVERLIADHGARLADAEPVKVAPNKGETPADALARTRKEISRLREELGEVRAAPVPAEELKARIPGAVEALAEKGRPRIQGWGDGGLSVLWPGVKEHASLTYEADNAAANPAAFMAWLDPAALTTRLEAEVDAQAPEGRTLSAEEKAKEVARLEAAILAAERAEEVLVEHAVAAGFNVQRRPDADARAVLGVAISEKAEKELAAWALPLLAEMREQEPAYGVEGLPLLARHAELVADVDALHRALGDSGLRVYRLRVRHEVILRDGFGVKWRNVQRGTHRSTNKSRSPCKL